MKFLIKLIFTISFLLSNIFAQGLDLAPAPFYDLIPAVVGAPSLAPTTSPTKPPGIVDVPQEQALKIARSLRNVWEISTPLKYQYKLQIECFPCAIDYTGPWLITVENGVSTIDLLEEEQNKFYYYSPEPSPGYDYDYSEDILESYGSIDNLYAALLKFLRNDFETVSLEVDIYNNIFTSFFIDISQAYVDDEFGLQIYDYQNLDKY